MKKRPEASEYPAYYQSYLDLVRGNDVLKALKDQVIDIQAVISEIPEDKENFAYAESKWTIKQVLGHVVDTERIMAYRALCIARKDKTKLPGFDEKLFVANADFETRTLYTLAHEFAIVRESNISLFKTFKDENLDEMGNANGKDVSLRAVLYMIAGHATHHLNVIKTRYLLD